MAIRYKILTARGTVKAYLRDTKEDVNKLIEKIFIRNASGMPWRRVKDAYRSSATCGNGDIWNEDTGRRAAKDKVLIKYYDDKIEDLNNYAQFFENCLKDVYEAHRKAFNVRANYISDLQKLNDCHQG